MKRNWDVVREILLEIEKCEDHSKSGWDHAIQKRVEEKFGITSQVFNYHLILMVDGKLIKGEYHREFSDVPTITWGGGLTWDGQDLLDDIRANTIWGKEKKKLAPIGTTASHAVLKAVAKEEILQFLDMGWLDIPTHQCVFF